MNKKIWVFALAVLAFAGCEEEEKKVEPSFIPSGEYVSIDMGEGTRTSLSADNKVTWTTGDAVGMFCAETECANVQVVLPDNCNGEQSVVVSTPVQFNAAVDKHTFYLYYPYRVITGAMNGTTEIKARLRHQQTGLLRDEAFTMAKCVVEKPDGGRWGRLRATFQNPFAYIRFCVKDTREGAPARTIHNVSMEAITALSTTEGNVTTVDPNTIQSDRSAVFGGVFTADLTKPEDKVTFDPNIVTNILYVNPAAKPKVINEVLSNKTGGYDLNESILMLINPAEFGGTNKFFRITFSFSDGTVGYAIKSAKTFEPNKVYNYGFKYENLNFNSAATIRVWPWTEIANSITFD